MEKRNLGNSKLEVSALGLGCMGTACSGHCVRGVQLPSAGSGM